VRVSTRCADDHQRERPDDQHRNAVDMGSPARVPRSKDVDQLHVGQPVEDEAEDLAAENRRQPVAFGSVVDAADDGLTFDQLREEDGEAAQDEQEGQRHDEARQPGPHHDPAVERADGDAEREGHQDRDPDRPLQRHREDGD
jgi:hypothetical protein